jgi:hypothetical protein
MRTTTDPDDPDVPGDATDAELRAGMQRVKETVDEMKNALEALHAEQAKTWFARLFGRPARSVAQGKSVSRG